MNQSLHIKLKAHAITRARGIGAQLGMVAFVLISLFVGILVWLESFRYFEPETKMGLLIFIGGFTSLSTGIILVYYWLLRNQRIKQTRPEYIANLIGDEVPEVGDRILNAVQLNAMHGEAGISQELQKAAVQVGIEVMDRIPRQVLFPLKKIKIYLLRVAMGFVVLIGLYFLNFQESTAAIKRLSQPETRYEYPLPLSIHLSSNKTTVIAGDTLAITGQLNGRHLKYADLIIQTRKDTNTFRVAIEDQQFTFPLEHLITSFTATAQVSNHKYWEPWTTITSNSLDIQVINRPLIQNLSVRIRPPAYTRLPIEVHTRDILDISGFKGTRVSVEGLVSKEVKTVKMHFDQNRSMKAEVNGQRFTANFDLTKDDNLWFELTDDEGVNNSDPLVYPIYVAKDMAPLIRVMVPGQDVIIGESMLIPTRLKMDDDFGFSKLELSYQIQHPDFLMADTNTYKQNIALPQTDQMSLELSYAWDINKINIMPEDMIEYWFTVWDNNSVDGPRKAMSKKWVARLPSLDEMFGEVDRGNDQVREDQAEVLDVVKDIREKVDQLALEVQKDPNLTWDQKQEAEEAIQQVGDLQQQLEKISQQLDEMMKSAQDQNLFSKETLDKYAELQQLMEQLITPELREAMEKLQQALEQNNPRDTEMAMQDFQTAMEDFQKSLERTLEIFKQVELEQKIDELNARLTDLAERQETLVKNLDSLNAADASQLEKQITRDFNKAEETAEALKDLLDQREDLPSEWVQDLQKSITQEQISKNLNQAADQMQQGQIKDAKIPSSEAAQSLRKLAQQSQQMQENLQQMMMDKVISEFRSILLKTLNLSQSQEALERTTQNISKQSSLLRDQAESQMDLMQGLQQVASDLKNLGESTFSVSPSMGRSMGATQAHMQEAINQMEARNTGKASQAQNSARENLNRMAMQIASSMESLQASGEASGFSEYMEQLQQMAGQQQGLNQQTMLQLGQGSQSMMQQLARQQMQLHEALSQIEKGMGSDSRMLGDLGKIGDEMEAVAKELLKRRPAQNIHEQQERILTRLLDAQRSATQRDFSKKRKSETAGEKNWLGSGSLPDDLGEARNLLYEELIFSLKQNYDREEQALIREYFNLLETELNE